VTAAEFGLDPLRNSILRATSTRRPPCRSGANMTRPGCHRAV